MVLFKEGPQAVDSLHSNGNGNGSTRGWFSTKSDLLSSVQVSKTRERKAREWEDATVLTSSERIVKKGCKSVGEGNMKREKDGGLDRFHFYLQ